MKWVDGVENACTPGDKAKKSAMVKTTTAMA